MHLVIELIRISTYISMHSSTSSWIWVFGIYCRGRESTRGVRHSVPTRYGRKHCTGKRSSSHHYKLKR